MPNLSHWLRPALFSACLFTSCFAGLSQAVSPTPNFTDTAQIEVLRQRMAAEGSLPLAVQLRAPDTSAALDDLPPAERQAVLQEQADALLSTLPEPYVQNPRRAADSATLEVTADATGVTPQPATRPERVSWSSLRPHLGGKTATVDDEGFASRIF